MRFKIYCYFLILVLAYCGRIDPPKTVRDIEGNLYHTISIGNQVWMVENLRVTKFRNRKPIPNIISKMQWSNVTAPAYCSYDNNDSLADVYGRLYNWYTVNDNQNIAPEGWHVPTEDEWMELIRYLGDEGNAGGKLKETGSAHWQIPNTGADNTSGFSSLPAGYRNSHYGTFHLATNHTGWWSAKEQGDTTAWIRQISFTDGGIFRSYADKKCGFSIRCVMD